MMRYLLDTNLCIYLLQAREPALERFEPLAPGEAGMSVITAGELFFGAYQSQRVEKNLTAVRALQPIIPVAPLPREVPDIYGRMRFGLEREATPVRANDLWIAAHALAANLTLVTHNAREFGRVEGLTVENWL